MAALSSIGHPSSLEAIIRNLKDLSIQRKGLTHLVDLGPAVEKARLLALTITRIHRCSSCTALDSVFKLIQSPVREGNEADLRQQANLIDSIAELWSHLHPSAANTSIVSMSSSPIKSIASIAALVPQWKFTFTLPELETEALEIAQSISNKSKDLSSLSELQIKKLVDGLLQLGEKGQLISRQIEEYRSAFNGKQTIANEGIQKKRMDLEDQIHGLRRRKEQDLISIRDHCSRKLVNFSVKWSEVSIPHGKKSVTVSSKDPIFDSTIRAWGHEFWVNAKKCCDGRVILSLCVDRGATVKPFNLRYQFLIPKHGKDELAYETAVFTEKFGEFTERENRDFLNLEMLEELQAYNSKEGILTFGCLIDFSEELRWGVAHYEEAAQTPSLMPSVSSVSTPSVSTTSSSTSSELLPSWTEILPLPKIQAEALEMARGAFNSPSMPTPNIEMLAQAAIQVQEGWRLFNEDYTKHVVDFNRRQTMAAQEIEQQFARFRSSIEEMSGNFEVRIQKLKDLHSFAFLQFIIPVWSTIIVPEGQEYVSLCSLEKTPATEVNGHFLWLEVRKFRDDRVDLLLCTDGRAKTSPFDARYQLMAYHGGKKKPVCQSELRSITFDSEHLTDGVTLSEKQLIEEGALRENVITFGAIIPFTSLQWGSIIKKNLSTPVKV